MGQKINQFKFFEMKFKIYSYSRTNAKHKLTSLDVFFYISFTQGIQPYHIA